MKKITLLLLLSSAFFGFSQNKLEKIQQYLNDNKTRLGLSTQDIQELIIESEAVSEGTGINACYVKQRYQGIELFNSTSNFWIKNNAVINGGQGLIPNITQKVNTTAPSLSVLQALSSAVNLLEIHNAGSYQIIEETDSKHFKISNGNLDAPITAELVYQLTTDNKLRLAWDFTIDVVGHQHMWSVRIDALDGKILDKHDMVISCSFGDHPNHGSNECFDGAKAFASNFFKEESSSILNVNSGSYRVIPFNFESPNHSPRQLISTPHDVLASPYGWHDTNGVNGAEFTITRGNNVHAQDDANGDNGTGVSPQGGTSLNFDFPYNGTFQQPATYLDAATTNLFYMTNVLHDVWYRYGFNEVNGNFQQNNYGRGGFDSGFINDHVLADSQDGSTAAPQNLNNANFATPIDGQSPRMQMFLWNVTSGASLEPLNINSPADIAGPREGRDNVFNPGHVAIPVAPAFIQSDLVLYNDGTADPGETDNADGCAPAVNAAAINGKIAVIRRSLAEALGGTPCAFTEKVKNAQNAGATAVIIVNNVDPSDTVPAAINMSGADATITIPAISLTKAVGYPLIERIKIETVNAKLQVQSPPFVNSDGSFDNGIIAHEFGHGISNRLTGGPGNSSCLTNAEQMGEGWSDWFALMMQIKTGDVGSSPRGIGTFAVNEPTTGGGIRTFQYSTDMSINPLTFSDSNITQQHSRGEFMATVLWDLTWAYIQKYGFDSNIYTGTGGNNKVMRLVIDGLILQPCNPTIVEFRDALLAAEQATSNGADNCLIKEVFRRRGVGLNATSGSRDSALDQVESFTAFPAGPNCTTLATDSFDNEELFKVYPNPTNGEVNIRINNFVGKVNIQVIDINGRVVNQYLNTDFNIEKSININQLQAGIYILKVNSDTVNFSQKIVLK